MSDFVAAFSVSKTTVVIGTTRNKMIIAGI
jgi:hypothetical protein